MLAKTMGTVMEEWVVNLLLAVGIFLVILIPQFIPWGSAVSKRPLKLSDLDWVPEHPEDFDLVGSDSEHDKNA
jgi:hypothetical protein